MPGHGPPGVDDAVGVGVGVAVTVAVEVALVVRSGVPCDRGSSGRAAWHALTARASTTAAARRRFVTAAA
ncbi:hypothetical protein ASD06_06125 [Angustibacter sp. Root456]|nr:hypothetical protein ASD06_06125 [Angustibacter sp. Root456]